MAAGAAGAAGAYKLWPSTPSFNLPVPPGQAVGPEYLSATLARQSAPVRVIPPNGKGWSSCIASESDTGMADLDLVLAVDTTGSMGWVLSDVKSNLQKLISNLQAIGTGVRVGLVAYKDLCDREMIRSFPLTPLDQSGAAALDAFISTLTAAGGCDWEEKMDAALDVATRLDWRMDVPSSIVVIADAPAHRQDQSTALAIAHAFRTKIPDAQVSLIDTGSGGHPFMRALPREGGGQYVTYNGQILNSLFPAITGCQSA